MADLMPAAREKFADRFDCPRCRHGGRLEEAPNEEMPNGRDFDFRCDACAHLFNLDDVMEGGA